MKQLSKKKAIFYHLYPGVIITAAFIFFAPIAIRNGFPPQFALLMAILIIALPVLIAHLYKARKEENLESIFQLNGFTKKLPTGKLVLFSVALVIFAFVIWGVTQPLNQLVTQKLFSWLPDWYTMQDFKGYSKDKILITLVCNLLLNGLIAPYVEELYFRGYLLARMNNWGKSAFIVNAVLFSIYHFWQPYIYITLILALLPMTYLVWKTKDLRLGILTHCLLNLVGAVLSFGLLQQQ